MDGIPTGKSADRLSSTVGLLLIDRVRVSFREDAQKLESISQRIDHVKDNARIAQERLRRRATRRLESLEACLERVAGKYEGVATEIQDLTKSRNDLQSLLDRANLGRWSELEREAAKAIADTALSDAEQEIAECQRQIETLLTQCEQLVQEGQACAVRKSDCEQIESTLTSGREPQSYREALAKESTHLNALFRKSRNGLTHALAKQRASSLSAKADVLKLKRELNDAGVRASHLETATHLGWLARRLDPRQILWRGEDDVKRDLDAKQSSLEAAHARIADFEAKLDELGREHERQLGLLPGVVRRELVDETRREVTNASTRLAEIGRLSDELSARLDMMRSDMAARQARYAQEHQRYLEAHFTENTRRAKGSLRQIDAQITDATARKLNAEGARIRFSKIIERHRERLDVGLLELKREEKTKTESLEYEAFRVRLRLQSRAPRAGMVHGPTAGGFREQDVLRGPAPKIRVSYRSTGDEASPLVSLPILLQRREETGYVGWDDERLASVLASIHGEDTPGEDERPVVIDHFCDIVFGDDQEERPFFISIISEQGKSLIVLARPATVLPQLKSSLPVAMSVCVLCRFEYSAKRTSDNTTVQILDAALVPDCEQRPFERTVLFVRHSSRTSLPLVSSPLNELLDQVNASPPRLLEELQYRLNDWEGYLDWANDEILRRAPWAALGHGKWTNDTWEGEIFCEDQNAVRSISGDGTRDDMRRNLEIYRLKDPWQRIGSQGTAGAYRCTDFKVLGAVEPEPDGAKACPWPHAFPCRVSMRFSPNDVSALADLPNDTPLGLRDMTEAIGSQVQLSRYRNALTQLRLLATERRQSNRLPAAPYLMASLFNVTQAARPASKPGQGLNTDIAKDYRLNDEQGAAVEVMLAAPEIAYIQGPPGTGKTTMIAAACAHFVRSGQRVLIASQTNLAVENALERLIQDPEVRPLWLSRTEGEQKKSAAVADWYRMAADHAERAVCDPFRKLTDEVARMQNWLERARKLDLGRSRAASDLQKREDELRRSESRLTEKNALHQANSEARARAAWWAMAHEAVARLANWDPSCFSPTLVSDAADLLKLLARHDGNAPRLDVSSGALHRQAQERIQALQANLHTDRDRSKRESAERIRKLILDSWPDVASPEQESLDGAEQLSVTVAQAEASVLRARQSLEDAQIRANEINEKIRPMLSEISGLLNLPQGPTDLGSAIEIIERHADLQLLQMQDVEPLREWLPLLDQWVIDLRQQADSPPATDKMGERYVRSANVIGITCNSDFRVLSDNGFPRFDVVIVDEVSKATPLELLRPMLLAPKAILVGDHRQLPPTFEFAAFGPPDKSPTEDEDPDALEREAELLRKYERLTTASLFRDGFSEIDPGARAALYTQYRMHPQIMSLVNRFYDGRLKSGLVDPDGTDDTAMWSWRTHGLSLPSRTGGQYLSPHLHALWVDSSEDEGGRQAYEDSANAGICNDLEARLVAQIVEDIVVAWDGAQRKKTIAVATFYNRQKRLIRDRLQKKLGPRFMDLQIAVETVDRFQGKEADIVIVSMVRNRSRRLGRNSNPAKFERINVAFSRARDLLVVVGARKTFERFEIAIEPVDGGPPRRTCVYGQIMDDIRDAGGLWQARDILGAQLPQPGDHGA